MPVKAACPSCHATLSVPSRLAGHRIDCPRCSAGVQVPAADPPVLLREGITAKVGAVMAPVADRLPAPGAVHGAPRPAISAHPALAVTVLVVGLVAFAASLVVLIGYLRRGDVPHRKADRPQAGAPAQPQALAAEPAPPPAPPVPVVQGEPEWHDASSGALAFGDLSVRVTGLRIDYLQIETYQKVTLKDKYLLVHIHVENRSETRKLFYRGWGELSADAPRLTDNFGNRYDRWPSSAAGRVVGEWRGSLYPGKGMEDVIAFEGPVDRAEWLRLELPASAVEGEGVLRFHIPKALMPQR
jgi:hypothetical protein